MFVSEPDVEKGYRRLLPPTSVPFEEYIPRPFTVSCVRAFAPTAPGLYGITNSREWIYIGVADNIQAALLIHMNELETSLMQRGPKGFVFELCERALSPSRHDRLILEYEPTCNRRVPRKPEA